MQFSLAIALLIQKLIIEPLKLCLDTCQIGQCICTCWQLWRLSHSLFRGVLEHSSECMLHDAHFDTFSKYANVLPGFPVNIKIRV